jgi:hypothetical protein
VRPSVSNIPVTVTITNPDNTVTTLNETYAFTRWHQRPRITLPWQGTFNYRMPALPIKLYRHHQFNRRPGYQPITQQTVPTSSTGAPSTATNLQAYFCDRYQDVHLLTGNSDGGILWYKNIGDALPFSGWVIGGSTTVAPT